MSCNGRNHRKDCTCNFRGGASTLPPPSVGTLLPTAPSRKPPTPDRPRPCPHCGELVLFRQAHGGGRFYATRGRSILNKHECEKLRTPRKLRITLPSWRNLGWLPCGTDRLRSSKNGQLVTARSLSSDEVFKFRMLDGALLKPKIPFMYRNVPDLLGHVEIRYFDGVSGELTGPELWACKFP